MGLQKVFNTPGSGSVAARLLANGMDVGAMRPYHEAVDGNDETESFITVNQNGELIARPTGNVSLLRKDEWKQYDQAVLDITQSRLVGIQDLISRGLVYNIGNGMGTTVLEYEDISDVTAAEISMDAVTPGRNDRPQYDIKYLPLPITHKDFQINIRALNASRTTGRSLDTVMAQKSARKIAESLETQLFTATSYTYGGGVIYSYLNAPNRNQGSLTANWDDSAAGGENILTDVLAMKAALIAAGYYGPYVLYVPTNFETSLDEDFKAGSDKSVRQRLLEVGSLSDIKVVDTLTSDNVVMVQMTEDVVRLVVGLPITTIEWDTVGGMVSHFKVITIQVPQVRADQAGNSGIAHWT